MITVAGWETKAETGRRGLTGIKERGGRRDETGGEEREGENEKVRGEPERRKDHQMYRLPYRNCADKIVIWQGHCQGI